MLHTPSPPRVPPLFLLLLSFSSSPSFFLFSRKAGTGMGRERERETQEEEGKRSQHRAPSICVTRLEAGRAALTYIHIRISNPSTPHTRQATNYGRWLDLSRWRGLFQQVGQPASQGRPCTDPRVLENASPPRPLIVRSVSLSLPTTSSPTATAPARIT